MWGDFDKLLYVPIQHFGFSRAWTDLDDAKVPVGKLEDLGRQVTRVVRSNLCRSAQWAGWGEALTCPCIPCSMESFLSTMLFRSCSTLSRTPSLSVHSMFLFCFYCFYCYSFYSCFYTRLYHQYIECWEYSCSSSCSWYATCHLPPTDYHLPTARNFFLRQKSNFARIFFWARNFFLPENTKMAWRAPPLQPKAVALSAGARKKPPELLAVGRQFF